MSDDRRTVPLFLCCAEDNEVALVRVVEVLQKEGYNPEVVAGVDGDGSLLGAAVDQAEARALFVLCRSDALDRSHVRRLEGLFSARRGPQQRSVTVTLLPDRPLEIMPAVRDAMKGLLAAPREPMRPSAELSRDLMRDVIGPEARDSRDVRGGDAEREELARKLHDEMVAAEALLTRRVEPSSTPARQTREDLPAMEAEMGDGVPQSLMPEEETSAFGVDGPPTHDEETLPLGDGSQSALPFVPEELGESGDEHPVEAGEDGDEAAASVPDGKADPSAADSLDEDTNEQEVGSTTGRHSTPVAAESGDERPVSRGMVYAGIAGLAAVVVMAISFMGAEPDSSDAEIEAAVDRAKAKAEAKRVAGGGSAKERPEQPVRPATEPVTPAAVNPAISPTPAPDTAPPSEPTPDEATPTSPETPQEPATPPEPEPVEPPAEPEPEPERAPPTQPPPPTSRPDPDAKRIAGALAAGRIRDLGSKVASLGDGESMTWTQANVSCRRRSVDGLGQWRLPNQRELKKMKSSGVLAKGAYYWAKDKAEEEDDAYALDTGSGEVNVYLKMESIARAACIRRK